MSRPSPRRPPASAAAALLCAAFGALLPAPAAPTAGIAGGRPEAGGPVAGGGGGQPGAGEVESGQEAADPGERPGESAGGESPPALEVVAGNGRTSVRLSGGAEIGPVSFRRVAGRLLVALPEAELGALAGRFDPGAPEVTGVEVREGPAGGWLLALDLADGAVCDLSRAADGVEIGCGPPTPGADPSAEPIPEDAGGPPPGTGPGAPPGEGGEGTTPGYGPPFRGAPVTLDFRDADLRDVLRMLSEVSGLDFVLQPGVAGRVSLRLTETPWDQALEVILRSRGLDYLLEGGVLRVGSLADLVEEQVERRRQEEARSLAGERVTLRRRLAYARPEEVREALETRLSERGRIIADPRTGTVIVSDVRPRIEEIAEVLGALDIPVPGIEIEARIVLATRTLARQLGIQWGAGFQAETGKAVPSSIHIGADGIGAEGSGNFDAAGGGGLSPPAGAGGDRPGYGVNLPISGAATGALGIALGALGGDAHLDLALTAAERAGEVRILSAPRIAAQNARPATIKQGVTFPVQVVANNTVTVQFQEAVLELTVTPWISRDGTVLLDLAIHNDQLDFGQAVGGIPSIVTQQAATRIRVDDASTAVLGGVYATRESKEERRVPGLSRIPLLGHLFRSVERTERDEELLIFLTPRIVTVPAAPGADEAPDTRPEPGAESLGKPENRARKPPNPC